MAWQLSSIFYSMLGTPQDFRKESQILQFSPNSLVAQRSGKGPSNAGQEDGNPAATDTSQAGLTTVLWVGGRQAAGGGSREGGREFASSSHWVYRRREGERLVLGSLYPVCLESGWRQGFIGAMLWDSPPACALLLSGGETGSFHQ